VRLRKDATAFGSGNTTWWGRYQEDFNSRIPKTWPSLLGWYLRESKSKSDDSKLRGRV
jgi:hypothetical protein